MSTPTPADLKARYPEFNEADDNQVGLFISEAALEVNERRWGRFYSAGVLALAAHMLSIATRRRGGTGAGALTGKKVGEVQLNYAAPTVNSLDESALAATAYGQRYLQLRKLVAIPVMVVP